MLRTGWTRVDDVPDKELLWLHVEIKSPPFSFEARQQVGGLLRVGQRRSMSSIGAGAD